MYDPITTQRYRVEFAHYAGETLHPDPVRNLSKDDAVKRALETPNAAVKLDGILTTIRAFVGDNPKVLGDSPPSYIDEPVFASVMTSPVYCGDALAGIVFEFQPGRRTVGIRGYLVTSEAGMRVAFSPF